MKSTKTKILSILASIVVVLIVSLGVMLTTKAEEAEVKISIKTDKSVVKAGDVITVDVVLDSFSTTATSEQGSRKNGITTVGITLPIDTEVFEFVSYCESDSYYVLGEASYNTGEKAVKVALTGSTNSIALDEEDLVLMKFKIKVKEDYSEDKVKTLELTENIFRNLYVHEAATDGFSVDVNSAEISVMAATPVIKLNGALPTGETYDDTVVVSIDKGTAKVESEDAGVNTTFNADNTYSAKKNGTYKVTATDAAGNTCVETFTVVMGVKSIEVVAPTNTTYVEDADNVLDVTGGLVKIKYNNDEVENIALAASMCSTVDLETVGTKTVTVTYKGKTDTFDVVVKEKEVVSIEMSTNPTKNEYVQNTSLDVAGGKIKVNYNNGKSEVIDVTAAMCSTVDMSTAGTKTVTVTYKGKTTTFEIMVVERSVDSFTLNGVTGKSIVEGMSLDLAGMTATVVYDNLQTETVNIVASMLTYNNTTVGTQVVTVKIGNVTKTFEITVKAKSLVSIEVTAPTNTTYIEEAGNTLSVAGGELLLTYDNNTTETISLTASMCSAVDLETVGTKTVTVTYEGKTDTFAVTVVEKSVAEIAIENVPDKVGYIEGQNFDVTGGKIKVSYNNGKSEVINMTAAMCSTIDMSTAGTKTVTVTYKGKTTTFEIMVVERSVVSYTLNGVTGKSIVEGMSLDLAGMTATVVYDNQQTDTINLIESMLTYDNTTVGTQVVTVKIGNVIETFEITVRAKSLVSIGVTAPTNTTYIEEAGNTLSIVGGELSLIYDNNTTETISLTTSMCSVVDLETVGTKTVTVTYEGKTDTFEVTVVEKSVAEIAIENVPDKVDYIEGQNFDVTGGKIKVSYDNGKSEVIDMTAAMCGTIDTSTIGEKAVTVTYEGKTATFNIVINKKVATSFVLSGVEEKEIVEGLSLVLEGMTAEVTYNDGDVKTINLTASMLSYDNNTVGVQTVTVTIDNVVRTFEITVKEKSFIGLQITKKPNSLVYFVGDEFSSKGILVEALYDNNTAKDVTELAEISGVDMNVAGICKIIVTYTESEIKNTAEFEIEIITKENVDAFNKQLDEIVVEEISLDDKALIEAINQKFKALKDIEKSKINLEKLEAINAAFEALQKTNDGNGTIGGNVDTDDTNTVVIAMVIMIISVVVFAVANKRRNYE